MSKIKTFKDILLEKNNVKQVFSNKSVIQTKLKNKTTSEREIQEYNKRYKEMWVLINNERCLICQSQLDGGIYPDVCNVFCSSNPQEYKAKYIYGLNEPILIILNFYFDDEFGYRIISQKNKDIYNNIVYKINYSLNERARESSKEKIIEFEGEKFGGFRKNILKEDFIKKLEIYSLI